MPKQQDYKAPVVVCFSGHDPVGGAGIQADIEAITANQAHACSVITALTVQDSHDVYNLVPVNKALFNEMATTLLKDVSVDVFKTGLLADAGIAGLVADIAATNKAIPLIVDPVLATGAGTDLANEALLDCFRQRLLPLAHLATPNLPEAQRITGEKTPAACAEKLLATGCPHILLTGTHATTTNVINTLYSKNEKFEFEVKRLNGEYHGSGCTLAASLAAQLALGHNTRAAVSAAIEYTWQSLNHARSIGRGQSIPQRQATDD